MPVHEGVLESRLDAFHQHAKEVSTFLASHGVEARATYSLELAFEELATNVIKYAFDDPDGHSLRYSVRVEADHVGLWMEDDGRPFDPASAELPEVAEKFEEASVGGLGLHILRRTAQSFDYRREDGLNRVEITFPRGG